MVGPRLLACRFLGRYIPGVTKRSIRRSPGVHVDNAAARGLLFNRRERSVSVWPPPPRDLLRAPFSASCASPLIPCIGERFLETVFLLWLWPSVLCVSNQPHPHHTTMSRRGLSSLDSPGLRSVVVIASICNIENFATIFYVNRPPKKHVASRTTVVLALLLSSSAEPSTFEPLLLLLLVLVIVPRGAMVKMFSSFSFSIVVTSSVLCEFNRRELTSHSQLCTLSSLCVGTRGCVCVKHLEHGTTITLSIDRPTNQWTDRPTNRSTDGSINRPTNHRRINQSPTDQPIDQSISQSIIENASERTSGRTKKQKQKNDGKQKRERKQITKEAHVCTSA